MSTFDGIDGIDDIIDVEIVEVAESVPLSDSDVTYATYLIDAVAALDAMNVLPEYTQGRHHRPDDIPSVWDNGIDVSKIDMLEAGFNQLLESFEVLSSGPSPITGELLETAAATRRLVTVTDAKEGGL